MKFNLSMGRNGTLQYHIGRQLDVDSFFLLMESMAKAFGAGPEFIPMPEAEIVKIMLTNGKIYAKFDFAYGVDIDCDGISPDQKIKLENLFLEY